MAYINRKNTEDAIRRYADIKHSNGEQIEYVNGILKAISVINEQPTADVAEVKRGYWREETKFIITDNPDDDGYWASVYICSNCGREESRKEPYCHCGAKMDGGKK